MRLTFPLSNTVLDVPAIGGLTRGETVAINELSAQLTQLRYQIMSKLVDVDPSTVSEADKLSIWDAQQQFQAKQESLVGDMLAVIVKSRCKLAEDTDLASLLGDLRAEDYNQLYDFIAAECGLELESVNEANVTDPK